MQWRKYSNNEMNLTEHVKVREEKFGSVIFETLREKIYVTNKTGSDILKLIKEGRDKESIVRDLCGIYAGEIARINNEVTLFLNQLKEKGLITE